MRNLSTHWNKGADMNALIAMPVREKIGRYKYTTDADIENEYKNEKKNWTKKLRLHSGRRTSNYAKRI